MNQVTRRKRGNDNPSRHDVRLEIRVRNNLLYEAIMAKHKNVSRFCASAKSEGINILPVELGKLLNLKASPFVKKSTEYRVICLAVERALKTPAEDLFPVRLYKQLVPNNVVFTFDSSMELIPSNRMSFIEDNRETSPEVTTANSEVQKKVETVLKTLTYREREVLKLRFGIDGGYEYTIEEIGRIFKVQSERIRQIITKAILKLQHPIRATKLLGFVPEDVQKKFEESTAAEAARKPEREAKKKKKNT